MKHPLQAGTATTLRAAGPVRGTTAPCACGTTRTVAPAGAP